MGLAVGMASVAIVPSFAGFAEAFQAGMDANGAGAAAAGTKAGAAYGDAAAVAAEEATAKGSVTESMGASAASDGAKAGAAFGTNASAQAAANTARADITKGLGATAAQDGSAVGTVLGSSLKTAATAETAKDSITKSVGKTASSDGASAGTLFGKAFSVNVKTVLAGVGAIGAFEFFKDAISEGNQLTSTLNVLQAHLNSTHDASGETTASIKSLAEGISDATGNTTQNELAAASRLLTFPNVKGAIYNEALPAINDIAASMNIDLPSAAKMLGKALEDPAANLSALSRLGITFTAGQKDQIKSWEATGNMAEAQSFILQQVNQRVGGSADAAATPTAKLHASMQNMMEDIGVSLIPMLNKLIAVFVNDFLPPIEKVAKFISDNATAILTFVAAMATMLAIVQAVKAAQAAWNAIQTIGAAATKVWAAAQAAFNAVMALNPVALVVIAIVALVAIVTVIIVKMGLWHDVVQGLQTAWTSVVNFFTVQVPAAFEIVVHAISTVVDWIENHLYVLFAAGPIGALVAAVIFMATHFTQLKDAVVDAVTAIEDAWDTAWSAVKSVFDNIINTIKSDAQAFWEFLENIWNTLSSTVQNIWSMCWGSVASVFDTAKQAISNTVNAIWNTIQAVWNTMSSVVQSVWSTTWGAVTTGFDVVKSTITNTINTIWNTIQTVTGYISGAFSTAVTAIQNVWDTLQGILRAPVAFIVNTIYEGGIRKIWNDTAGAVGLGNLPTESFSQGGVVPGHGNGLVDTVPAMLATGEGVLSRPEMDKIGGPSGFAGLRKNIRGYADGGVVGPGVEGRLDGGGSANPSTLPKSDAQGSGGGGIIGDIGQGLGDITSTVAQWGKDAIGAIVALGADAAGDVLRGMYDATVKPMISRMPGAGGFSQMIAAAPDTWINSMVNTIKGWVGKEQKEEAASFAGTNTPGNVESWITQGMADAGVSGNSWASGLSIIAMGESGGNPNAVNRTDSNAQKGTPSAGLMQFIQPTFDHYAKSGFTSFMNPIDQVVADAWAGGYINSRYGGIDAVPGVMAVREGRSYVGYDNGGILPPGLTMAYNGSGANEAILTSQGLNNIGGIGAVNSLNTGGSGGRGPLYLTVKIGEQDINDLISTQIEQDNIAMTSSVSGGWRLL